MIRKLKDACCSSFTIHVTDYSNPENLVRYSVSRHGAASDFDELQFEFECPKVKIKSITEGLNNNICFV